MTKLKTIGISVFILLCGLFIFSSYSVYFEHAAKAHGLAKEKLLFDESKVYRLVELSDDVACKEYDNKYDVTCIIRNILKFRKKPPDQFYLPKQNLNMENLYKTRKELGCKFKNNEMWNVIQFKNDVEGLLQHIFYHFILGISHFLIYEKDSFYDKKIYLRQALENLVEAGYVTIINSPATDSRTTIYTHALEIAKQHNVDWISVLDCNEFLIVKDKQCINEFFRKEFYETSIAYVGISSYFQYRKKKLIDQEFLLKGVDDVETSLYTEDVHMRLKAFSKVDKISRLHAHFSTPHYFHYGVNTAKKRISGAFDKEHYRDVNLKAFIVNAYYQSTEHRISKVLSGLEDDDTIPSSVLNSGRTIVDIIATGENMEQTFVAANTLSLINPEIIQFLDKISRLWLVCVENYVNILEPYRVNEM